MTIFVSMLRGVNVGGHGRIKMEPLKQLHEALGLRRVETLLQSGNVVFETTLKDREKLARRIEQELERRFELQIEVIVRSLGEIRDLVERGPLLSPRADPSKLLVMFLSRVPDARALADLVKSHKGPEMLEPRGPEIYLYYPEGVGRSKLSGAYIENRLGVSGTARNWNTLTKLLERGSQLESGR